MTVDEIKQRAKNCAEFNIRLLEEIKRQNYDGQWSEQFVRLVREQKSAVKRFLNWIRLDPDFQFNSTIDLLRPQYRQGTEAIGDAIGAEVDAVFGAYETAKGA